MLLPLPVKSVSAIKNFMPSFTENISPGLWTNSRSSGRKCPIVPLWTCRDLFPCSLVTSLQRSRPPDPPGLCPHLLTILHHNVTSPAHCTVLLTNNNNNNTKCGGFLKPNCIFINHGHSHQTSELTQLSWCKCSLSKCESFKVCLLLINKIQLQH